MTRADLLRELGNSHQKAQGASILQAYFSLRLCACTVPLILKRMVSSGEGPTCASCRVSLASE